MSQIIRSGCCMKVGIMLPSYARWFRGDAIWAVCEKAKEIGLDSLCFFDHVIFTPKQYVGYGNGYMDCWTAMAYVAAVTNVQGWKPILTNSVVVIPYRPPIQQGKVIATVDSLSGGRVMVGAGSGYNENEFASLGLNVKERGDMTDEYLACMKELWTHPVSSFHGKYANFDEMTVSVRPTTQPYPPVLYGSHGARPRRRVAERYQGVIQGPGRNLESQHTFDSDMTDLTKLWKEHGRIGKPYIMAGIGGHITTDRSQVGQDVVKGVTPDVVPAVGIGTSGRVEAGQERAYVSTFRLIHVDTMIEDVRRADAGGVDMAIFNLPSYRFGGLDNQSLQLQQMEVFAEHVMPKIPRDKKPIEMDFDGKKATPFAKA
ncbi:MAG: LLM class flavin-dependent oxidoreductase [Dehalococcoidia bacterium]|nr:LLM class flavin-dependent oxidoreductase [Dehalococcoidia bacterium]